MMFYRFKTRSSYYFPNVGDKGDFIYTLYGSYGGKVTKAYWWMFKNIAPFRWLHAKSGNSINNFDIIRSLIGNDCIYGINLGTPGPEQKMSILGYNKKTGNKFFAKLATKDDAKKLSKNEIKVYETLTPSGLTPKLYEHKITNDYVYLKCECIVGEHVKDFLSEEKVLDILNTLRQYHYDENKVDKDGFKTCFAHNDFCLWNMLNVNGRVRLIDWEMADEYPLGHDLFTYIFQTTFLVWNSIPTSEVYDKNLHLINKYFQNEDYMPYLKRFVDYKIDFFSKGQNPYGLKRYMELKGLISRS